MSHDNCEIDEFCGICVEEDKSELQAKIDALTKVLQEIESLGHDDQCASDQGSRDGDCMADHRCYCAQRMARKALLDNSK